MKYCLISLGIIAVIPTVIALITQISVDTILTFHHNLIQDLKGNEIFIAIQVIVLIVGIWFIGGKIGQHIIEKGKSKYLVGGFTLFMLWVLLFVSSAITAAIGNTIYWGPDGFEAALLGWVAYGLLLYLCFGVIHGLTMGYFLGWEVKKRGNKLNNDTTTKPIAHSLKANAQSNVP